MHALKILDTPQDERFDRIARLAATHFDAPMARLTFVDQNRTWYKSCVGPKAIQSSRSIAICAHTVMSDEVLISRDLSRDPRFEASPQVVDPPHLRFYAGAPIILDDGMRVGSLCVIDLEPRPAFSEEDCAYLADLAQIAVHELELHRQIADRDSSLAEALRQTEVARRAKKRFMSVVSHELKTPLSHVLGFGKILAEQQLGPLGKETYCDYARDLCRSAERLESQIDRVLSYASAEAGELKLAETEIDTEALLRRCLSLIRLSKTAAGIEVRLTIDDAAPTALYADEVQITEVVVELLENAIAFSPRGSLVELELCRGRDGGPCLRVLDRGPGIDPASIQHLMFPFTQGDESLKRHHEGIGLGLPVAHAIVELHGGILTLTPRPGGGTVVEAVLPADRNRSQVPASHA